MEKFSAAMAAAAVMFVAAGAAYGQTARPRQLPPGPGLDLINERCVSCHTVSMITSRPKDAAGWATTLQQMASRGAEVSPEEMAVIIDYLVKALPAPSRATNPTPNARQGG